MSSIVFYNLNINPGMIRCDFCDQIGSGTLAFDLSVKIIPSNDLIAIALSTLCGRGNYQQVKFDFPVSEVTVKKVREFCNAEISFIRNDKNENAVVTPVGVKTKIALSFSGGFDSLAAKFLMPDDTSLVSMDFGGAFSRERVFFSEFNTHVVTTNLLATHLRRNSWSFMGIAAILYSDYLGLKYHTFGGILEAGANNFAESPVAAKNITFPPFAAAGMINAPYVLGITEIGTAMILMHYAPNLVYSSLNSLANAGEEKKYRKQIIASMVAQKMGANLVINNFDKPQNPWVFGQNFAVDFLAIYFLKFAGMEVTSEMVKQIPDDIVKLSEKLSLKFYERVNTNFLENFPKPLLGGLLQKLSDAQIIPYTADDWREFNQVVSILKQYYKI